MKTSKQIKCSLLLGAALSFMNPLAVATASAGNDHGRHQEKVNDTINALLATIRTLDLDNIIHTKNRSRGARLLQQQELEFKAVHSEIPVTIKYAFADACYIPYSTTCVGADTVSIVPYFYGPSNSLNDANHGRYLIRYSDGKHLKAVGSDLHKKSGKGSHAVWYIQDDINHDGLFRFKNEQTGSCLGLTSTFHVLQLESCSNDSEVWELLAEE